MHTIEDLRTGIDRLTRTLRAIEGAPEELYYHSYWANATDCGTAYCTAGWQAVACPEALELDHDYSPVSTETHSRCEKGFADANRLPWHWSMFLCANGPTWSTRFRLIHDGRRATAIHRLKLTIRHLRRRLAIMEAEQGHWQDIVVGQAREKVLQEAAKQQEGTDG